MKEFSLLRLDPIVHRLALVAIGRELTLEMANSNSAFKGYLSAFARTPARQERIPESTVEVDTKSDSAPETGSEEEVCLASKCLQLKPCSDFSAPKKFDVDYSPKVDCQWRCIKFRRRSDASLKFSSDILVISGFSDDLGFVAQEHSP